MGHSFTDTLMYEPPNSAQWVPLATFSWNVSATQALTGNDWFDYVGPPGHTDHKWAGTIGPGGVDAPPINPVNFAPTYAFPNWTRIDVLPWPF